MFCYYYRLLTPSVSLQVRAGLGACGGVGCDSSACTESGSSGCWTAELPQLLSGPTLPPPQETHTQKPPKAPSPPTRRVCPETLYFCHPSLPETDSNVSTNTPSCSSGAQSEDAGCRQEGCLLDPTLTCSPLLWWGRKLQLRGIKWKIF